MVDEIKNSGFSLDSLRQQENAGSAPKVEQSEGETQKTEFLQILVTQLENQDPLNPMENDQFAVDLAQFSQLEQLINLNEAIGSSGLGGEVASLSQYLGQEISINSEKIALKDTGGDKLSFSLGDNVGQVRLEMLNTAGDVVETVQLGAMESGRHSIDPSSLTAVRGDYNYRVVQTGTSGDESDVSAQVSGIVNGFVPGPEGLLLMGDKEVPLQDVVRVDRIEQKQEQEV